MHVRILCGLVVAALQLSAGRQHGGMLHGCNLSRHAAWL